MSAALTLEFVRGCTVHAMAATGRVIPLADTYPARVCAAYASSKEGTFHV